MKTDPPKMHTAVERQLATTIVERTQALWDLLTDDAGSTRSEAPEWAEVFQALRVTLGSPEPTEPGQWLIWNGDEVEPNGWGPIEVFEHENQLCIDIGDGVTEAASNYLWNGRAP